MEENQNTTRPELTDLYNRRQFLKDEHRPEMIAKLHGRGQRTARENLADICDPGTFREYGDLVVAAQRRRYSMEELMTKTPVDGIITGTGSVNGQVVGYENSQCNFIIYDPAVIAGTQGHWGHKKMDRILGIAGKEKTPVIIFAQGGGGRPNDTDGGHFSVSGTTVGTWGKLALLNGKVPTICIIDRYSFAGNAALAGCCDVLIATKTSSIGMGGPAMIEGGGLGVFPPEAVGPADVQYQNGVIDILVENEAEAVSVAKKYLSYFQGRAKEWEAPDQTLLRSVLPERRRRAYDIRKIINILADKNSVLEIRKGYAPNMVTCLVRFEGKTCGIVANCVQYLGGAIDAHAADKFSRFIQLCNAFGFPILSLVDCPGYMVGPDAEKIGLVRHACRMYVNAAHLKVPYMAVFVRKTYGLGALAMGFGDTLTTNFAIAWPTAEFGGMGLEGQVKLSMKHELEKIANEEERQATFEKMVNGALERGKAINAASFLETDTVIDPAETRDWIMTVLRTDSGRKEPTGDLVDSW